MDTPPTGDSPTTPAIEAATRAGVAFDVVRIERPSSVEESAERQGVEVDHLIRTIVVRRAADDYLFLLIPGGRQIDWPKLRAHLGIKRMTLPDQDEARDATGYERGAITPFGASTEWPVIADTTLVGIGRVAIGGGAHGVNLHLDSDALIAVLDAQSADVTKAAD